MNPRPLPKAKAATFLCAHEASGEMSGINHQEMREEERKGAFLIFEKARITVTPRVERMPGGGGASSGRG